MKNGILFWAHVGVIIGAMFSGFFLTLPAILVMYGVHRLHMIVFRGCILSQLQDDLPRGMTFFQFATKRLTGLEITEQQAKATQLGMMVFSVIIAATL